MRANSPAFSYQLLARRLQSHKHRLMHTIVDEVRRLSKTPHAAQAKDKLQHQPFWPVDSFFAIGRYGQNCPKLCASSTNTNRTNHKSLIWATLLGQTSTRPHAQSVENDSSLSTLCIHKEEPMCTRTHLCLCTQYQKKVAAPIPRVSLIPKVSISRFDTRFTALRVTSADKIAGFSGSKSLIL